MSSNGQIMPAVQPTPAQRGTPETRAAARALGWEDEEETHDLFAALDAVGREAESLGQRLSRDRSVWLAGPATLIAAVARRQVVEALGTDLYPCRRPVSRSWRIPRLHRFSAEQAAQILLTQLHKIALGLAAAEGVPAPLRPQLLCTVAALLQALAQFQEAMHAETLDLARPSITEWLTRDSGPNRDTEAMVEAEVDPRPRARIQLPILKAVVREHAEEVRMQVYDAYTLMAILWRGCRLLRWRIRSRRETHLLAPLSVAMDILARQVRAARGKPWNSPYQHGLYGWDPSRAWLGLPGVEALDALREELHTLATTLVKAADFLPDAWYAALSHCAGALLLAAAHLREAVETAREGAAGVETGPNPKNSDETQKKDHPEKAGQDVTRCDGM